MFLVTAGSWILKRITMIVIRQNAGLLLLFLVIQNSLHFIAPSNALKMYLNRALKTVTEEDTRKFPMINGEGKKVITCGAISCEM